ncbi:MOSC domain-containing protein [Massilia sp. R798]|uniref:MOSC domain-containing protein n=1 Tax=Massilia soli TaxID=2792854 RepID=A0ABS7SU56_9BURK|nr:MOSC domain-containing protein [Massilia soli]
MGQVTALTIRTAAGSLNADRARLIDGAGIDGDVHADPLSPRQLLLASAQAYDQFSLPPHALRENLLVDFDTSTLVSGAVLRIGGEVRLRLMFQCEACGQLDIQQSGLSRKLGTRRGMLARVLAGGLVQRGDRVQDLGVLEAPWPEDWRRRIAQVLDAVPPGAVIEYKQLARLAGVQPSYCRAFPRLIDSLGERYAAKAIAARSASMRHRWNGEGLFER